MGWKIDDIVHAQAGKYAKQFECSICTSIWHDPVETPCCSNNFCRACISKCAACPMCRLPLNGVAECSKAIIRMLNAVEVRCPHHFSEEPIEVVPVDANHDEEPAAKRCKKSVLSVDDGCAWEGSYGDLLNKHLGECPFHPVPCPRECGEMVLRKDMGQHEQTCAKLLEKCSICGKLVKPDSMSAHRQQSAELHVQLLEEKLEVEKLRAAKTESESGSMADILRVVQNVSSSHHVVQVVRTNADEIKAEVQKQLQKQLNRHIVWKIHNAAKVKDMAKGESLKSALFNLCGEQFRLEFFPKGSENAHEDCATIGMTGQCSRPVSIKMTFNSVPTLSKLDTEWASGSMFTGWPLASKVFETCGSDIVVIEVEVIRIAEVMISRPRR